jgi:hypothetical protein
MTQSGKQETMTIGADHGSHTEIAILVEPDAESGTCYREGEFLA